jgi:hypothetical protein
MFMPAHSLHIYIFSLLVQKKRPRKEVMASEARKKKASDSFEVKKERGAPKPNKDIFSKSARDAIKIALDNAAAPMKGSKGNKSS